MSNENEAQTKEDMLLDLYKTLAYLPNDAKGNPLTPFGDFCEGWEACEAHNQQRIDELEAQAASLESQLTEKFDEYVRQRMGEPIGEIIMRKESEWMNPHESVKWHKTEFPLGTKFYALKD